jgi:hypothetical protein
LALEEVAMEAQVSDRIIVEGSKVLPLRLRGRQRRGEAAVVSPPTENYEQWPTLTPDTYRRTGRLTTFIGVDLQKQFSEAPPVSK